MSLIRWKQIVGTKYRLSDTGLVQNTLTKKYLAPNSFKYPVVRLCTNGIVTTYALHRLVAEYFVPNPNNLPLVLHKDNNTKHYFASNLCWGTYEDNIQAAIQDGINNQGHKVGVSFNGKLMYTYDSLSAAAKALGLAHPTKGGATHVKEACEGRVKTLKGFSFSYIEEAEQ